MDSKSIAFTGVRVQVPPSVSNYTNALPITGKAFFVVYTHVSYPKNRTPILLKKSCEKVVFRMIKKRRSNDLNIEELKVTGADVRIILSFDEAFSLFVEDCYLRNLRPQTIKYYHNEINAFKSTLRAYNIEINTIDEISTEIIKTAIRAMQRDNLKPVTINTRIRALNSFFNFLVKNDYLSQSPMNGVSKLKEHGEVIEVLTEEELNQLLNAPDLRTFTGYRDYVILSLFVETGIRISELVGINVEDLNLSNGTIVIKHAKTFQRTVPIQSRMKDILQRYLLIRGEVESDALFITVEGNRISNRQIQNRLNVYGKKIGKKVHPHLLRHSFARLMVIQGTDAFTLMALLGHTDITITKRYVHLFSEDVQEVHKRLSPLNKVMKNRLK